MPIYLRSLFAAIISGATLTGVAAQPLPPEMTDKIDSLFGQWDKTSSPGCAIGIVRNDSLIFSKGHGMANGNRVMHLKFNKIN